jgi:outer membrane protein TolC
MDLRTQPKSLALRACLALLIALPAVAGWCRAQSQDPVAVTLPEAVQIALARHPDVEKTRAAASQMKGRLREVRAQALPEVNFHSSLTTHVATGLRPGGRSGVSGAHGASRHRRINYSTLLTLILVPVVYTYLDNVSVKVVGWHTGQAKARLKTGGLLPP